MEVKVIHKSTGRACEGCSSWLKHWEKLTHEEVGTCRTKGRTNPAKLGVTVKRKTGDDRGVLYHCVTNATRKLTGSH